MDSVEKYCLILSELSSIVLVLLLMVLYKLLGELSSSVELLVLVKSKNAEFDGVFYISLMISSVFVSHNDLRTESSAEILVLTLFVGVDIILAPLLIPLCLFFLLLFLTVFIFLLPV